MNRHDDSSASGAPLGDRLGDFSAGTDSPVRIDSSHSRLLAARSRTSAGTIVPDAEVHDVARHQVGDLDAHRLAIARRRDLVADLGVHRLRRAFCPVLVDEPETDRRGDDHPDDDRVEALADDRRHRRRGEQEPQQRAAQLASEHRPRARMMGAHRVRPERSRSGPTPPPWSSPDGRDRSASSTWSGVIAAAASIDGSDAPASTHDAVSATPKSGGYRPRTRRIEPR